MILDDLLKGLCDYQIIGNKNVIIENLTQNSQKNAKNTMFFCINGTKTNGELYIKQAIQNGAVAVVVEKPCKENITQIIVKNVRQTMAIASANFFDNPQNELKIVGITGTNGKTSCSYIIGSLLKTMGKKVGIIGTNGVFIDSEKYESNMTTPDSIELFEIFAKMAKAGIEYCIMEVSAHAIYFDKIYGINFSAKALTNVNFDHLDFFKTKQNYQNAKVKFFEIGSYFVLNADDKIGKKIAKNCKNSINFGKKNANLHYFDVKAQLDKTDFKLKYKERTYHIFSKLVGEFNVQNLCLSVGVLLSLGFDVDTIVKSIPAVKSLPGRFDLAINSAQIPIVIDYAHTFESLKTLLNEIKRLSKNKNIIVFGAPGERDTTKRLPMGELAGLFCDYVILTADNPASENPKRIAFEISQGIEKTKTPWIYEENRKKAIKKAIIMAKKQKNCNVLIVGKGIETYQIIGDRFVPYSDYDAVNQAINKPAK